MIFKLPKIQEAKRALQRVREYNYPPLLKYRQKHGEDTRSLPSFQVLSHSVRGWIWKVENVSANKGEHPMDQPKTSFCRRKNFEIMLPIHFCQMIIIHCRGYLTNVSPNKWPRRPSYISDWHEKHTLGKGHGVFFYHVLSYSVQRLHRRTQNCLSHSEARAAILADQSNQNPLT